MQVREQHLVLAQPRAFLRLRFLDLDDELALGEYVLGAGRDLGADAQVIRVAEADARCRSGLDAYLVTRIDELADGGGHEPDAVFVDLDFLRYTDAHGGPPDLVWSAGLA